LLRPRSQNPKAPIGAAQITDNGAAALTIGVASQLHAADNDWRMRTERTLHSGRTLALLALGDGDQRGRTITDHSSTNPGGINAGRYNRSPLIARNKVQSRLLSGIIGGVQYAEDRPQLQQL
jgi:hypothetical protein